MTPIVFFDIAGPDTGALASFYKEVFGWDSGPGGSLVVPSQKPLHGTFRQDPAERVIYLGVDDINAAFAKITEHGGKPASPRIEVPGVVIMGLFTDPAGNRMGLVEMDGDAARLP
jgi:predicted enzyme related to lactoylglutathione lyase